MEVNNLGPLKKRTLRTILRPKKTTEGYRLKSKQERKKEIEIFGPRIQNDEQTKISVRRVNLSIKDVDTLTREKELLCDTKKTAGDSVTIDVLSLWPSYGETKVVTVAVPPLLVAESLTVGRLRVG